MTRARASEIVRFAFYRHLDKIAHTMTECDNHEVVFDIGRYLGMMQNDLEAELEKEIEENEHDGE